MLNKEIENVVFYNSLEDGELKAYIFYKDGTTSNVSSEEGYKAVRKVIIDEKLQITNKEELKEKLINRNKIYVMHNKDLNDKFESFIGKGSATVKNAASVDDDFNDDFDDNDNTVVDVEDTDMNFDDDNTIVDIEDTDKKKGIIKRTWERIKKSKLAKRLAICALALGIGATGYALGSKSGKMTSSNIENTTENNDNNSDTYDAALKQTGVKLEDEKLNNTNYYGYKYSQLKQITTNETQKTEMSKVKNFLDHFNIVFANKHVEEDKDIRAALTFDETMALNLAYNNFSTEEIKAMFNGSEVNALDLQNAYRTGTLQLMGAYVIETEECKVGADKLINNEKDLKVYNEYHDLFLNAKKTTGEERINYLNKLYEKFNNQFPISEEIRTEGIAHADARSSIDYEQLSAITPMIAAAEMMFQNEKVDVTLNQQAIDFLNDLGVCNYNDKKFEEVALISKFSEEDEKNPTYDQFKNAIVKTLEDRDRYVIDDAHRDLSKLDSFQKWVNGHFQMIDGEFSGGIVYETTTHTETSTRTESSTTTRTETTTEETSDRNKAVEAAGEEAVKQAEDKVDAEIEKQNEENKKKAEKEAKKKQEEMQKEADKDKEKLEEQIRKEEQDLEDKIKDANDKIDENNKDQDTSNDTPVKEEDFGNVNFDENGDQNQDNVLDDDVKDITTDGTGDQTGQDLPDPNQTGADFEISYNTPSQETTQPVIDEPTTNQPVEPPVKNETSQVIYEYEVQVENTPTNEEIVDQIVESMATETYEETESYQMTK